MIPLISSAIGAGLNYWFVRAWGERAKAHFRDKHLRVRQQAIQQAQLQGQALTAPATLTLPGVIR
jgi:hypothetical protein